jgi:hypothetical protein
MKELDYFDQFDAVGAQYAPEGTSIRFPGYQVIPKADQLDIFEIGFAASHLTLGTWRSSLEPGLWDIICGIAKTIFSQPCSHRHGSQAGSLGAKFKILPANSSFFHFPSPHQQTSLKCLCALHRCGSWQLAAMALVEHYGNIATLHNRGCLKCALELCSNRSCSTDLLSWMSYL